MGWWPPLADTHLAMRLRAIVAAVLVWTFLAFDVLFGCTLLPYANRSDHFGISVIMAVTAVVFIGGLAAMAVLLITEWLLSAVECKIKVV